jgi:lipopolysaccharide export system permease protein
LTLQLYILRQLLISFAFALAGIGLLVVPSVAIQAIHKLGGVSLLAILDYLPLVLVELVPYVLPMAFLLGVVATFGRLTADKELIASAMAGIHPARLLIPGLLIAVPLVGVTSWMLASVSPEWKYVQRDFMRKAKAEAFRSLSAARTEMDCGGFYLKAESAEGNLKKDVILSITREDGEEMTVVADEVLLAFDDEWFSATMTRAQVISGGRELESENPSFQVPLASLFPPDPKNRRRAKYLPSVELREEVASGNLEPKLERSFRYEIHRRHALSLTYVLFLLLGVSTGILIRSGTQLGAFTSAMGYAFLYYVLAFRLGKVLSSWDILSPLIAAWSTNLLFLAVGVFLSFRTLWR